MLSTEIQLHTARCLSPLIHTASSETACVRLCACVRVRLPDDMHSLSALNSETEIHFISGFLAHSPFCVLYLFPPFFLYLSLPPVLLHLIFLRLWCLVFPVNHWNVFSFKTYSSLTHIQFLLKPLSPFLPPPHQKQLASLLFLVFPTACSSLSPSLSLLFSLTPSLFPPHPPSTDRMLQHPLSKVMCVQARAG